MVAATSSSNSGPFRPLVCVVDFHHARGPEIEQWFGVDPNDDDSHMDPAADNDWSLLPFLALPDGSHSSDEELSYFTLRHQPKDTQPGQLPPTPSSVFGIACTRHIDARELAHKSPDVTRSSVQKSVVAIVDSPYYFPRIREQLSAVTKAWFAQKDFTDTSIITQFHESVIQTCKIQEDERDQYFGLSLREFVHDYKFQTLVLLKCCLLQRKMIFYGTQCERLCMLQFALISLIPGLLKNLRDCADPSYHSYEDNLVKPSSLRTSERASLLAYMGLPLQIFGKGSLFGPYTPLQQLEVLDSSETKSYVAGSTNSLLLTHAEKYSDILVNLDDATLHISSPQLRSAVSLTTSDRRWMDFLTQSVADTWDPANPTRPTTHGYAGSEEFIRLQFEEYLLALLSCVKHKTFIEAHPEHARSPTIPHSPNLASPVSESAPTSPSLGGGGGGGMLGPGSGILGSGSGGGSSGGSGNSSSDPSADFGANFLAAWQTTDNYRLFNKTTDSHLFDIVEPRHPCAGGLTIEDIQRRVAAQIAELHLDERFNSGKEVISKHFAQGSKKVSGAFNSLWADIEQMREAQRKRSAAAKQLNEQRGSPDPLADETRGRSSFADSMRSRASLESRNGSAVGPGTGAGGAGGDGGPGVQAKVQAGAARASAYISSWGSWAAEKRRSGWPSASGRTSTSTSRTRERTGSPSALASVSTSSADEKAHGSGSGSGEGDEDGPEWVEVDVNSSSDSTGGRYQYARIDPVSPEGPAPQLPPRPGSRPGSQQQPP